MPVHAYPEAGPLPHRAVFLDEPRRRHAPVARRLLPIPLSSPAVASPSARSRRHRPPPPCRQSGGAERRRRPSTATIWPAAAAPSAGQPRGAPGRRHRRRREEPARRRPRGTPRRLHQGHWSIDRSPASELGSRNPWYFFPETGGVIS